MSYEPTTWVTGDIITATKLNNIESGVQSVSSSYTPTTWATGDIITAVKLNNIEQGIANAGGGSSDFSTATVTVVNNMTIAYMFFVPTIYNGHEAKGNYTAEVGTSTITVILYQGMASMWSADIDISSVSGSAVIDDGVAIITGDCTITVS